MKKIFIYFLCILCTLVLGTNLSYAQQLPDPGFEDWNGATFDGAIQPTYWHYSNVSQMGFDFNFSDRQTGRSGSGYSLQVANKDMVAMGINGGTSPGYVTIGQTWLYVAGLTELDKSTAGVKGGIPWTYRPDSLSIWIKRTGGNVMNENYNIVFYSWFGTSHGASYGNKGGSCSTISGGVDDEESDIRQALDANGCQTTQYATQVAEGSIFEKASYPNWTQIRIPIYYFVDQAPTKCCVILSAGNYPAGNASTGIYAGNTLCVDDIEMVYSSKIQKLYVGNREWKGFDPNAPVQTYSLGNGVTTIPAIYAVRGAGTLHNSRGASASFPGRRLSNSECVITPGQVDGAPTIITVHAEDGSSTTTYQINFVSAASNNARLADIRVNGTTIPGFNAYVNNYNVSLPYGTTAAPVVAVDVQDAGATAQITQATSPTGTATIQVTAQDGSTTQTYTVKFSVAQLTDNTLQDILVDGVSLQGFLPSKSNYTLSLPLGTTAAPTITPVSAYPSGVQTINVTNDLAAGCVITVSVPGNSAVKTYRITYKVEASSNSQLADLQVGGTTIPGFDPSVTSYTIPQPLGTTAHPDITWTPGDAYQTVNFTDGGLSAASKVTVTAANGSQTVYRINFTVAQSSNCALAGIALDGTPLENFDPDSLAYLVTLPAGTNSAPAITYTAGDAYQTITLSQGGLNAVSRITVRAGDGTTRVYTIRFQVTKSLNAFLKMIYLDGDSLTGFAPQTLDYSKVLTNPLAPDIAVEKEPGQTITISQPGTYGTARIVVKPEEGDANVYTIRFLSSETPAPAPRPADLLDPSNNPLLADILINGTSLTGFAPTTYTYRDSLPVRTWSVPSIMPVPQSFVQEMTIAYGKVDDTTKIHVVAEDGITTADYKIYFPVRKLDDCTLQDLIIDGVSFTYNPAQTSYDIVLPYGTTDMPNITPERKYDEQGVHMVTTATIATTSTATITVSAPSGASLTYTLNFSVAPSGLENSLTAIVVDGVGALDLTQGPNFDVVLPYGATNMIIAATTKRYPEQSVLVTPGGINGPTTIKVLSGQAGVRDTLYTLNPVRTLNDPGSLIDIKANGATIPAFKPYQYNYILPVTAKPEITYSPFAGAFVTVTASDNKHWEAEVESADGTYVHTYSIYYYYTNDVIPSGNFSSWSTTKYNAARKPTGWMAPADAVESYTFGIPPLLTATYTTGPEVRQGIGSAEADYPDPTEGNETVVLNTIGAWNTIAGSVAGIITTGKLDLVLKSFSLSTMTISGGIPFRNTPDTVKLDYKPIKTTRVDTWRFLFNTHQNGAWQEHLYTGSYSNFGTWGTLRMPLNMNSVDSINIIINSMFSENMDEYNGTLPDMQSCELRVRNLLLSYNSRLSSVSADGVPLTFTDGVANIAVSDPEYVGIPEFTFVGEVPDQEQRVSWSEWNNGSRTALIRNFAEDGSYTDYTVIQTRPISTSTAISYTVTSQNDLSVERGSAYQQVEIINKDTAYVIQVVAENGDSQRYLVRLTLPDLSPVTTDIDPVDPIPSLGTSNAQLTDIAVDDVTVSGFAPDVYLYNYPSAGNYSAVRSYPLDSMFQTIRTTNVTWQLFGETNNHLYLLNIQRSDNALLSNILVDGQSISGFYQESFDYVIQTTSHMDPVPVKGHDGQTVTMRMVDQGGDVYTYFYVVRAENGDKQVYTVQEIVRSLDTNADLVNIILGANSLQGFTPTQTSYTLNEESGYVIPDIMAVVAGENAIADISTTTLPVSGGIISTVITITVTAEAGNQKTYTVTINVLPSDECHLEMIYLNATELQNFNRETFTYYIELPIGTTALPEIDYTKADNNSTVTRSGDTELVNGAAVVTLTCTAESGAQKFYELNFTVAKSTDSHLAMIFENGTPLNGFDEDILSYNVDLPYGTTTYPTLTFQKKEDAQTVVESGVGTAHVSFLVTAEDGVTTSTYDVIYNILPSDNALLKMIFLNGDSLSGFQPDAENYSDTIPYEITTLPTITWTLGDEQQTVVLDVQGDVATLTVTAGDGVTTQTYTITFFHELCANNYLAQLEACGKITGFNKDSLIYEIIYPVGSSTSEFCSVDDIVAVPEDATATVAITQQDENTITVMVTAQNGDVRVYVISQTITLSDNAYLKMIYLDGVELPGFDKLVFSYSRLLAQGSSLPMIDAIPEDTLSDVSITTGAIGDTTYIYCIAQDGTEHVYTLFFDYTDINAGEDADIDDCVLMHVAGTDSYLAVTIRSDVTFVLCDTYGQRLITANVPVVDPNYVRVETDANGNQYIAEVYEGANGYLFDVPDFGKTFFAIFFRQGGSTKLAKGAKFMLNR